MPKLSVSATVALMLALVGLTGLATLHFAPATGPAPAAASPEPKPKPKPPTIQEDDPRWNCSTMGNRQCGPSRTFMAAQIKRQARVNLRAQGIKANALDVQCTRQYPARATCTIRVTTDTQATAHSLRIDMDLEGRVLDLERGAPRDQQHTALTGYTPPSRLPLPYRDP